MKTENPSEGANEEIQPLFERAQDLSRNNTERTKAIYQIGEILLKKGDIPEIPGEIASLIHIAIWDQRKDIQIEANNVLARLGIFKKSQSQQK